MLIELYNLNSLTDDLQYAIEYPTHDGSLPYMDILIHADKSTIHICLQKTYTHQPLCPQQFLCPLILQRQCYQIPHKTRHLQKELDTVYTTSLLTKWTPPDRVKCIMDSVKQKLEKPNKLTLKQFNRQLKATTPSLTESFPFHPTITKKIKKSLASHDIKVTSSSGTTLRDLLTKTKTIPPPHLSPNVIYEISCNDCTATYNGQTNRPLIKRIKEHEPHSRLRLHNPDDFSHNHSAPAHHSQTTGHKIAWDRTTKLTTTIQDTRHNWTSQNTQSLKQETLHSTVQTVPLHAVNSGTPSYPKLLAP